MMKCRPISLLNLHIRLPNQCKLLEVEVEEAEAEHKVKWGNVKGFKSLKSMLILCRVRKGVL